MSITKEQVIEALKNVDDPDLKKDICAKFSERSAFECRWKDATNGRFGEHKFLQSIHCARYLFGFCAA